MQPDRTLIAKKAWETRRKNGNDTPWNKQEFIMVNCPTCKKVFSARQWKLRIGRDKHCSRECAYPGGIDITCWQCSKVVKVNRSRKNTAHFCSQACSSMFRDEGKRTKDKKIRQSAAYKKWRLAVFKRDNYKCTNCGDGNYKGRGTTVEIQADHIKPFALYPELRFDISNGRTLCVACHKATDTYGRNAIYRKRCVAAGSA